jgi:hypothetical protein
MSARTKPASFLLGLLILTGCNMADDEKTKLAKVIDYQKGRFVLTPASAPYPPMLVDSATGCVIAIRYTDEGLRLEELSYSGGTSSCRLLSELVVVETASEVGK